MAYTVQKLATLSGVSVRTLHFYDEIGLLKPAYIKENGYRYYEEKELLNLQQILFFRELDFELKKIQEILQMKKFDRIAALHSHKKVIQAKANRMKELLSTIDKTIGHLNGEKQMKEEEMYQGFITEKKQQEYLEYLKNKIGADHPSFDECEKNGKEMTRADMDRATKECNKNFTEAARLLETGFSSSSPEMQALVEKLYRWVKQFWTPDRQSFTELGQAYTDFEWKKFFCKYDPHHPRLAKFVAEGMKVFADVNLK